MATVAKLLERIEKRIAIASGMDVQVHAEDQLLEMLRHKYETVFDDLWWLSGMTLETFTLDGTAGLIIGDVTTKIKRYQDINGVFINGNANSLPSLAIGVNPTLFNSEAISPYADATKVFKVWPVTSSGDVHVWYRTRMDDDDWDIEEAETTQVNMDDELMITGTVYDYLIDDASNEASAAKYEQQFNRRFQQLVNMSFQQGISKHGQSTGIPTQWSIDG